MNRNIIISFMLWAFISLSAQQGFFLEDSWSPKTAELPSYETVTKTTNHPNVTINVDFSNSITKVSPYLFGHCVSQFYTNYYRTDHLLKDIQNLSPNILRYPAGSGSNFFYWNRREEDGPPADASVSKFKYGLSDDLDYMTNENFYTLCSKTNSAGINVVNYSYARFGTSQNPVAVAAHLAAEWVRYDNGRTKYWEIGNENYGSWEEGYEIDVTQNQDGQPKIQTGQLYGEHFHVFADSMRRAAEEINADIKLGAVCFHDNENSWNHEVISEVGNVADFLIVHRYLGQKRTDADYSELLNVASEMSLPYQVLSNKVNQLGFDPIPVALTEWNTNYEKSGQKVSYISGMFNTIAMGNIIQGGYGLATRWNLVWKYSDGLTHGLFNGNKDSDVEGLADFRPRPAFYYLYYFQQFFGDRMIACQSNNDKVEAFASSYSDGHSSVILVNKSTTSQTVKINMNQFNKGEKYYWYLLTGGSNDGSFSRKLYINGQNSEAVSGPLNYETIKAYACQQEGDVLIELPPLATAYALLEGDNAAGLDIPKKKVAIKTFPNPANEKVNILLDLNTPSMVKISIYNMMGERVEQLFFNNLAEGKHSLVWDTYSKKNASTFLLKAEINNTTHTKVIILNQNN